jgi:hypothetical protein
VLSLAALAPAIGAAEPPERAAAALKLLDAQKCDAAVELLNEGMLDNEPASHFIAGQLFQHGFCLVRNVPRALRIYERGALLGDRDCARTLALIHARGDGVPQSYPEAGRWYAVMRQEKSGAAAPPAESFATPDALVDTYIEAVTDFAASNLEYPREAIDQGVTGTVKVRFDPRFGRIRVLASSDSTGSQSGSGPNRHDFERVLLASYADALRVLPRPSMSPNVDNSVEREVRFDRRIHVADEPDGLQSLPR